MRIALISSGLIPLPPRRGGAVELYVYKLCEALRKLGVEAYVIDRVWSSASNSEWIIRVGMPRITDLNIFTYLLGGYRSSVLKELLFGFSAARLIKEFDIVHANTAWNAYVIFHVKHNSDTRRVYTCHNPLWPEEKVHTSERIVRLVEGSVMRRADAVIALNRVMRKAIVEKAGVAPGKLFTVPNGVDIEFFKPGLKCDEVYSRFGLWGKQVVLFVGRVVYGKGVHILLEATKILREEYGLKDVKTVVTGPLSGFFGEDKPMDYVLELYKYAAKYNLDVVFTGSLDYDELRHLYSCSHVFVLPSLFEAFPMVLIEAMSSGLPVVGSRAGGITSVIEDDVNGYLFNKNSSTSLAEKLFKLLSDEGLRRRMSLASRRIAVEEYSWEVVAMKMLRVYRRVLED